MKQSLEWHKEALKNLREYHAREQRRIVALQERADEHAMEITILSRQIMRAEKEGRDGFDSDRFNMPRHLHHDL